MKTFLLLTLGILFLFACRKSEDGLKAPQGSDLTIALLDDEDFKVFTKNHIITLAAFADYQRTGLGALAGTFGKALREADERPGTTETLYRTFGLEFDRAIAFQNALDNNFFRLLRAHPRLTELPGEVCREVIISAMTLGMTSKEPGWQQTKIAIAQSVNARPSNAFAKAPGAAIFTQKGSGDNNELTGDEIWYCVKEAIGLNIGFQLGVKKLAADAVVKIVTTTATKALAKFAGPIGTGFMVLELGFCLFRESED